MFNKEHQIAQLLLRAWPFPRGAGRIADRLFRNLSFSEQTAKVRTTDEFYMTVWPNDWIGRHIYLSGEFDRSVVEVLCKLAKPGDILLDVGANIGYVSACFLQNVQESHVVAVDPQPGIVELLRENLSQFGSRQQVLPIALSDRDGSCYLQIEKGRLGASKIVEHSTSDTHLVEMWSASTLLKKLELPKLDLIKLDVEGHEKQVLSSLLPAIERYRPRAILFEDHSTMAAPTKPIGAMLKAAGYMVFGIEKHLLNLKMIPIHSEADCTCNDYIATSYR
jgi:FkbM family methyltransferase